MHERVHVGARQVVLLVPRRRRKHDVGEQRRRRHPEVHGQQQIELAPGRLVAPFHVGRARVRRRFARPHRVFGADQMPQEVLVALRARAEQVRPPYGQHPRPVLLGIRVLAGEADLAGAQLAAHELGRASRRHAAAASASSREFQLNVGYDGIQPIRADVAIRSAAVLPAKRPVPSGEDKVGVVCGVVTPLVGGQVEERGTDHRARRARPVGGVGEHRVSGDRAHLLLADVVRPATTVDALASGERDEREERAVDRVRMEVVVRARAHDDHRPPLRRLGVRGELAADAGGRAQRAPT